MLHPDGTRTALERLLADGNGVLRCEPAWVARDFLPAGRRLGLPEPIILDAITRDASRSLNTRGGPRNMDEVRALAARQLLAIPPAPAPGAAMKPVAEASMAPVPGAGRRPQ